ncbi:MAG TPA: phosphate/phosphite/phosphonate ABC transporter substrate-binding protein [Planctomycetes bacterium]|nr:phosphate/phosphite/phosphonate ABC transporter substrate-binding protein [Planctomycetota bacterium]HIK59575.1 phosphate/phosphite/phosphonate ABC transporter substrate-binding protein [Planctomycetota bacterium]
MLSNLLLCFCPALPLVPQDPHPVAIEPLQLTFGLYQTDKATEMYRKFMPMLEAIQDDAGRRMGREVEVELRIFRSYEEGIAALATGKVDFVRFGPASYVLAKQRNKNVHLLAMEQKKGKTRFKGLIVARKDAGIASLADLKGKRFAFGDENSTIGRYLAQEQLVKAGLSSRSLSGYEFLGRHDKVARAVQLGDCDAGSLKESTFKKMNEDGSLVVVQAFDNVTKPWIAREGLSAGVSAALTQTLVSLKDADALAAFGVDCFVPSSDAHYDFVRQGMQAARRFNASEATVVARGSGGR